MVIRQKMESFRGNPSTSLKVQLFDQLSDIESSRSNRWWENGLIFMVLIVIVVASFWYGTRGQEESAADSSAVPLKKQDNRETPMVPVASLRHEADKEVSQDSNQKLHNTSAGELLIVDTAANEAFATLSSPLDSMNSQKQKSVFSTPSEIQMVFDRSPYREVFAEAQKTGKTVLFYFFNTECGKCQMMDTITFADAEVKEVLQDHFIHLEINTRSAVDSNLHELLQYFDIQAVPQIIFVDSNGEAFHRSKGYVSPASAIDLLREIKGKDNFRLSDKPVLELKIHADPSQSSMVIDLKGPKGKVQLQIYSRWGQLLKEEEFPNFDGLMTKSYDLAKLPETLIIIAKQNVYVAKEAIKIDKN